MKTGRKGIELIKKYEGFRSHPYVCPAGVNTIGYGATYYLDGSKVKLTDKPITESEADELLVNMLPIYEQAVLRQVTSNINQNQFDALVSFTYNLGEGNLKSSTLLKRVNNDPNDKDVANQFMRWVKSNGIVLNGLTKRRNDEADLYFTPVVDKLIPDMTIDDAVEVGPVEPIVLDEEEKEEKKVKKKL